MYANNVMDPFGGGGHRAEPRKVRASRQKARTNNLAASRALDSMHIKHTYIDVLENDSIIFCFQSLPSRARSCHFQSRCVFLSVHAFVRGCSAHPSSFFATGRISQPHEKGFATESATEASRHKKKGNKKAVTVSTNVRTKVKMYSTCLLVFVLSDA